MRIAIVVAVSCLTLGTLCAAEPAVAAAAKKPTSIPPQELRTALQAFAADRALQLLYRSEVVSDLDSPGATGELTIDEALTQLLSGTGLTYFFLDDHTITVAPPGANSRASGGAGARTKASNSPESAPLTGPESQRSFWERFRLAQSEGMESSLDTGAGDFSATSAAHGAEGTVDEESVRGIPEILVRGSKGKFSLNIDIARSRDDAQPYVVFDRSQIARSGANTIDSFLRQKLPSANTLGSSAQISGGNNTSSIALRGLGPEQTLVLVDGHRVASLNNRGIVQQPDLNGIPLAAVERIEVLPATASGIYGGGATGGVVNVILRRDYAGLEANVTYENTFHGGGGTRRVDLASGMNLEGGRTNIILSGSFSDGSDLSVSDRDFLARGRATVLRNNPAALIGPTATPPLGATTNIRSATGVPLTLKAAYGGGPVGSNFLFVPEGYAGPASDNGAALVANAGQYNFAPAATTQSRGGGNTALLNTPTIKAFSLTARREFTPWLDAYVDASHSENRGRFDGTSVSGTFTLLGSAAANPFNENIVITTPALGTDRTGSSTSESDRATAGLIFQLPGEWRASVDYTWNRTRIESVLTDSVFSAAAGIAVSTGVTPSGQPFDVFNDVAPRDFSQFLTAASTISPVRSKLTDVAARIAGPIGLRLPGGEPSMTIQLETRKEKYDQFSIVGVSSITTGFPRSQKVDSVYAELVLPFVSARRELPLLRLLELQLAGRHDRYSMVGADNVFTTPAAPDPGPPKQAERDFSSTDPMASIRLQPIGDVTLRASYGTGFLPPGLNRLVPAAPTPLDGASRGLTDPRRNNEPIGVITVLSGGNPDLRPEKSRSRSVGLIFEPRFAPGLRMSVDWTEINKKDNLQSFGVTQANINNELVTPGLITRGPASDGFNVGPILTFNSQSLNVARQDVEAIDFALDYSLQTERWGQFLFSAAATRNINNEVQILVTLPVIERVDSIAFPAWKGAASLEWQSQRWSVLWNTTYMGDYCLLTGCAAAPPLTVSQGSTGVPSQTYHDAAVAYHFGSDEGMSVLADVEVRLGVKNVFDKEPPFDATMENFYSLYGDPRLRTYFVSLRKSFF